MLENKDKKLKNSKLKNIFPLIGLMIITTVLGAFTYNSDNSDYKNTSNHENKKISESKEINSIEIKDKEISLKKEQKAPTSEEFTQILQQGDIEALEVQTIKYEDFQIFFNNGEDTKTKYVKRN